MWALPAAAVALVSLALLGIAAVLRARRRIARQVIDEQHAAENGRPYVHISVRHYGKRT